MTFFVGDQLLVKDNIGSMSSTRYVGDNIAVDSFLGTEGDSYVVGDCVSIWDRELGLKSYGGFDKIPPDVYLRWFNGYGDFMWEVVSIIVSATQENLGLYLVKRINNSDNLEIGSIKKIRVAAEGEVSFVSGQYWWNEPIIGVGSLLHDMVADDSEIYFARYGNGYIYKLNLYNGTLTYKGTMGGVGTQAIAYDGGYIYALDTRGTSDQYMYKIRMSDFVIVASYHNTSWGGMWNPFIIVDDKIWSSYAPHGGSYIIREQNKSDLSLTGVTKSNPIFNLQTNWQSCYGISGGYEYEAWAWDDYDNAWKKYSPTKGSKSAAITIENEFA